MTHTDSGDHFGQVRVQDPAGHVRRDRLCLVDRCVRHHRVPLPRKSLSRTRRVARQGTTTRGDALTRPTGKANGGSSGKSPGDHTG
jgi:hypothetical protein